MKSKACHNQKSTLGKFSVSNPTLVKGGKGGFFKRKKISDEPLLYYKTKEDIEAYRRKPVKQNLQWLEAQMEIFHKAMPAKAKRIREKLREKAVIKPLRGNILDIGGSVKISEKEKPADFHRIREEVKRRIAKKAATGSKI